MDSTVHLQWASNDVEAECSRKVRFPIAEAISHALAQRRFV